MGPAVHVSPRANNVPKRGHINPRSPPSSGSSRYSCSSGNPYAGYHFLRLAQSFHMSQKRDAPLKAMHYALKAIDCFEKTSNGNVRPELLMSLYLLAATKCRLGQYEEAISILKKALAMYIPEMGSEMAFGAFAGHMQLGDTYSMLGQYENAVKSYREGLRIQKQALGDNDRRVADTCRYIAESHLQVMQFTEAEELCKHAQKIHSEQCGAGSEEEGLDRKLMAIILSGNGDHEKALQNLALARVVFLSKRKDVEVAYIDASTGDTYLALGRYDEALRAYRKALPIFEWLHGEDHTQIGILFVSLAELYMKMGKLRESKSYCENALRIFGRRQAGHSPDEIATGLTELAGLFESMGEYQFAIRLFRRALKILEKLPGQQSEIAGIEAQMGVLFHMIGKYEEAYMAFKSAVCKFRCGVQKNTWFLGILLNQMGLACVGLNAIQDASKLFEEARGILGEVCGFRHAVSLAISRNLAGVYDALGRSDDAIRLLEEIVDVNEGRLGTVHPEVEEDRQRLKELLNEAGQMMQICESTLCRSPESLKGQMKQFVCWKRLLMSMRKGWVQCSRRWRGTDNTPKEMLDEVGMACSRKTNLLHKVSRISIKSNCVSHGNQL